MNSHAAATFAAVFSSSRRAPSGGFAAKPNPGVAKLDSSGSPRAAAPKLPNRKQQLNPRLRTDLSQARHDS